LAARAGCRIAHGVASSIRRRQFLGGVPAALATLAAPGLARARAQSDLTYPFAQVWQAAVRLVRVDLHCPITDRDEHVGYLMFEYADGGRHHPGSLELVRTSAPDGSERVRVVVQVPAMPSWVERMILDRLARKLRDDYGDPPQAARPSRRRERLPEEAPPSGGEGEGEREGSPGPRGSD
jgi:hypothetical protein